MDQGLSIGGDTCHGLMGLSVSALSRILCKCYVYGPCMAMIANDIAVATNGGMGVLQLMGSVFSCLGRNLVFITAVVCRPLVIVIHPMVCLVWFDLAALLRLPHFNVCMFCLYVNQV